MNQKNIIRYFILIYWVAFEALTVIDKIIPDVYPYWVGADFYTLFIKLFASLGITNPIFATLALVATAFLEIVVLVFYLLSLFNLYNGRVKDSEQWFYRGIALSIFVFSLFSIGDQAFGDRSNLLEHGIFAAMLIVSWVVFKFSFPKEDSIMKFSFSKSMTKVFWIGIILTALTSYSIIDFSKKTFSNKIKPVQAQEVINDVYKFDFPFLADKVTLEKTIKDFEEKHKDLKINYIYTAPGELNTKKKTHVLVYVFTRQK